MGAGAAAPHKRRRLHQGTAAAEEGAAPCDEQQQQHRLGTTADGKGAAMLLEEGATKEALDASPSPAPDPDRGPPDAVAQPRDRDRGRHTRYTCVACRGRLAPPPGSLLRWSGPPLGPGLPDAMYGTAQQQQKEEQQEEQDEEGNGIDNTEEQGLRPHIREIEGREAAGQGAGLVIDRRGGGGRGSDGDGGGGGIAPGSCSWAGPVCDGAVDDLRLQRLRCVVVGGAS